MNKAEKFIAKYLYSRISDNLHTQKVVNNASWLMFDKIIKISVGLFVGVWVTRYLGPEEFGKLNYAILLPAFFAPLASLSIDSIVVRELSINPDKKYSILGSAFIFRLIGSGFSFIAIILIAYFQNPGNMQMVYFSGVIAAILLFQSTDIIDLYFQSILKSKYSTYVRTASYLLLSGVKIFLIYFNASLAAFVWSYFFELALGSVGLLIMYTYRKEKFRDWVFDKTIGINFLNHGYILILQSFALIFQSRFDQLILKDLIDDNEYGQYAVAIRLIELLSFVPMALYTSVAPRIAEAKVKSEALYLHKLSEFYRVMFYIFIALSVPIFLFGNAGLQFLYGEKYAMAGHLFSLMSIRMFFTVMGVARSVFLVNENLFKFSFATIVCGAILSIGLNIVLIPIFKSEGAIWSSVASFAVSIFIIDLFYDKTRQNLLLMFKSAITFKK